MSVYLLIYLLFFGLHVYLFVYLSFYLSIHACILPYFYLSIYLSILSSLYPPIYESIYQPLATQAFFFPNCRIPLLLCMVLRKDISFYVICLWSLTLFFKSTRVKGIYIYIFLSSCLSNIHLSTNILYIHSA